MFNVGGKDQHESELHTQSMFIFIHLLLVEATDGMQHWHRTSEELWNLKIIRDTTVVDLQFLYRWA